MASIPSDSNWRFVVDSLEKGGLVVDDGVVVVVLCLRMELVRSCSMFKLDILNSVAVVVDVDDDDVDDAAMDCGGPIVLVLFVSSFVLFSLLSVSLAPMILVTTMLCIQCAVVVIITDAMVFN